MYVLTVESVHIKTISICRGHSTRNLMTHFMNLKARSMEQFTINFSDFIRRQQQQQHRFLCVCHVPILKR